MATPAPAAAAAAAAPAAAAAAPAAAAAGMPFPYEVLVTSGCPTACGRFKRGQDINRRSSYFLDTTVNNVPTRYTIKFDRSWVLVQTSTPAAGQPAAAAPQELYVNTTPTDALPLAGWVVRGGAAPAPTMELVIVEAGSAASLLHPDLVATLWSLNVAGECEAAFEALNIKTLEHLAQLKAEGLTTLGVTFETARRVLNSVAAPANEPFQVVPIFKGIGEIGKNLCFKLQITNLSHTPTSKALVLRVDATAYWRQSRQPLPTIEPWKSATVDVELVALPQAGIENLPEGFTVRLMEGENQVYQTPGLFHMKDLLAGLTAGLQPPRDSELYNVYMIGNPGAGKSSFVSHFLTLCSSGNNVLMNALAFGGGTGHCTKRITKYQTNVAFLTAAIDVPGTSKDIFTQDFTQRLLDGELPFNWSITENSLSKDMALLVKMQPSRLKRAAHSVVFFVPASALDDLHFLEDMTRILNIVREKGFNPIIMLSLVDTIDGEADIRYHPMQPGPKLKALMAKATRTFQVPPAQVLYCINYTSEQTRSFELDALCYKNWEVILHSAESFNHRPSIELSES